MNGFKFLLNKFSRVSTQRFIPEIDGLRFLAIMPVLIMHLTTAVKKNAADVYPKESLKDNLFNDLLLLGDTGVYVFFGISGFILALPYAKYHLMGGVQVKLGKYYKRRVTRLEPPYLLTLLTLFIIQVLILGGPFLETVKHLGASIFYMHNVIYGEWSTINPVAWSLEIEIQFYLLAPLLTQVFRIKEIQTRRITLLITLVLSIAASQYLPLRQYHLNMSILSHLPYFLTGFLFIDVYLFDINRNIKYWNWIGIIGIIGLFYFKSIPNWGKLGLVLDTFVVFCAVWKSTWLNQFFRLKLITVIGGMCYTIYLIHFAVAYFLSMYTTRFITGHFESDMMINLTILLPLILCISALAFLVIEKPFMYVDWPKKLTQRIKEIR
jgi:peptidoglycan/LPS O-acetylase OafA/YrhL